jgi:rhodanese-related sulfurtransferase
LGEDSTRAEGLRWALPGSHLERTKGTLDTMMKHATRSVIVHILVGFGAVGIVGMTALTGLGCQQSTTDKSIRVVSVSEVRRLMAEGEKSPQRVVLVDPRAVEDFEAGHIPGARNVRLSEVPSAQSPRKPLSGFETIVVYGENPGSASARAMTKRLLGNGYESVKFLAGGLEEWEAQGGPVVKKGER